MNTTPGAGIASTGCLWSPERLRQRYKFLRKLKEAVRFDLLYYPYWVLAQAGRLKGRWFAARPLLQYRIVDAVRGKNYRISALPEEYVEHPAFTEAGFTGEAPAERRARQAPCRLGEAEARAAADEATLREWNRKFNRAWRPKIALTLDHTDCRLLYKPYWIMAPADQPELTAWPESGPETAARRRLFLFDATTGLGGLAEFWHVVEYLHSPEAGHDQPE